MKEAEETKSSVFAKLNAVNCNSHTEKKNGLTYLSWAWAWQIVKSYYPEASYTIYEAENGIPYFTDGKTCWVKTGVTIEGLEHIEYLPIMDIRNRSLSLDAVTSMEMNKAIQRSLTKACARHGLGLYIYAGEDLPTDATAEEPEKPVKKATTKGKKEMDLTPMKTTPLDSEPNLMDAYQELNEATTHEALLAVWNKYKEKFGKDQSFVNAVKMHPNNKK